MKKMLTGLMCLLVVCGLTGALADTPPGFGYINTDRTNVRESAGGPIITRLNDGDAVYILNRQEDSDGTVWYRVNTEYNGDHPITVWVQARYVTAGSELFHDIVQVAAGEKGMLALQSGGTVVGVGDENVGTRVFKETVAEWKNVKQVACGYMTYLALLADGSLRGFGNMAYEDWNTVLDVRLLDAAGLNIAYVTEDGACNREKENRFYTLGQALDWRRAERITAWDYGVIARYPDGGISCAFYETAKSGPEYAHAAEWTGVAALDCGDWLQPVQGEDYTYMRPLLVCLRTDGTVMMAPEHQIPEAETWTGITDVKAGLEFIIGLRADGTVAAAGGDDMLVRQVSEWTDITAIDACMEYCVGLRSDGTLLFAGEYGFHY